MAGRQYGDINTVSVSFGTATQSYELQSADPFARHSLSFAPLADGSYALSFKNGGGDDFGAFLDNVALVSEPAAGALWLAGHLVLGAAVAPICVNPCLPCLFWQSLNCDASP